MPRWYDYNSVRESLEPAANVLFRDPRVQAVGVTSHGEGFGFRVVQNTKVVFPLSSQEPPMLKFGQIPISYVASHGDIRPLAQGPGSVAGGGTGHVPEQRKQRHLVCGLEIQNIDFDYREGNLSRNVPTFGTLGCFVRLNGGAEALLSCNHVIAGENSGHPGDRIVQPSSVNLSNTDDIAKFSAFHPLRYSSLGARPHLGNVDYNQIDAAVAGLNDQISFNQRFLPQRILPSLSGTAQASNNEHVFKVGRTTGPTHGEIDATDVIVGADGYHNGPCWFNRAIQIKSLDGSTFAWEGDSGAVIVNMSGQVLGLLFAGDDSLAWACPIDLVLQNLNCTLL